MVKSTVKKNWWLMYYHVFLLTRRIIPLLVLVVAIAGIFFILSIGDVILSSILSPIPVGAFVFLTMLLKLGIRLSTPP